MKILTILLLAGFTAAAPTSERRKLKTLVVSNESYFPKESIVYNSEHDIVSILLPLNSHNSDTMEVKRPIAPIFFVEADITSNGKRIDQGLYVLKNNKAKKLLDNGRHMAAPGDNSNLVYLGASDGIYVYTQEKNVAEKYGTINNDIIGIAKEKTGDVIYILTANKEVYKVTENGNKKEKIENIVNAQQIVLDYSNNIYFYAEDKLPRVRTIEGVKNISGLPENPSSVTLINPPYFMHEGILCVVNNATYIIYPDGTSKVHGLEFKPNYKPTAFSVEGSMLQYYAHDKKIYEYI